MLKMRKTMWLAAFGLVLLVGCGEDESTPDTTAPNADNSTNAANHDDLDLGTDVGSGDMNDAVIDLGEITDLTSVDDMPVAADMANDATTDMAADEDAGGSPDMSDAGSLADVGGDAGERLTWDGDVSAIFASECGRCHTWATSYAGVVTKIEFAGLESQVSSGHKGISGTEQATILAWIADGYPEN